jgi:S1-C subfamily serine protease
MRALLCLVLGLGVASPLAAQETPTARRLFERFSDAVGEVRTVEATSGAKRSLGTGFRVGGDGLIATNYHVISELVMDPERYRAELVQGRNEKTVPLALQAFDVVNDIAILRGALPPGDPLRLHTGELRKGERVFALGNPYDIGMSIIEGTYNGTHQHARNERIHFTGALNPGMSGGPALVASGEVMGVNVASAGESVAFLVPVARLGELLAQVQRPDFAPPADPRAALRDQLWLHQQRTLEELFVRPAPQVALGRYRVPGAPAAYFDCWGDTTHDDDDLYESLIHQCDSDDWVFIDEDHVLAPVWFRHRRLGTDDLPSSAFFDLYSAFFEDSMSQLAGNEQLFTPFRCRTRFVSNGGLVFKAAFCARAYRELEGLYDVVFKAAALGRKRQGLETALVLSAVSFENAERLARRYLEQITWSD